MESECRGKEMQQYNCHIRELLVPLPHLKILRVAIISVPGACSCPSMESLSDIQVEGLTVFASPPKATYRYDISLKGEKVNTLLEDRSRKIRCELNFNFNFSLSCTNRQTGFLIKEDYATVANVFGDASAAY
ncbi:hypothetical protein GQ600_24341 [Phytophthora cactorum]|nr:hypothetical protein GQ600_24341 [Phytophthora cactorum]